MSTYNGEKYIREQLDSILEQDCERLGVAAVRLLVRDDGSKDGTQKILEEYAMRDPKHIRWYQGQNVGVIKSFLELVCKAGESDYYAFSDQDDYWMPEKLTRAIEKIESRPQDLPVLYCCRPKLVDAQLQPLETEIKRPPMRPSFRNAMIENIATGCTEVWNVPLQKLLLRGVPSFTVMHDWWVYLTAACFGEICYDEKPFIGYRQHGGNVLGENTSRVKELKMRLKRYRGNRGNLSTQLTEFLRIFKEADPQNENIRLAEEFLAVKHSFWKRVRFFHRAGIYRQRKMDDRIFRVILWMGSY